VLEGEEGIARRQRKLLVSIITVFFVQMSNATVSIISE